MSLIEAYRATSINLALQFTQDDGVTPFNMSGNAVFFGAAVNYSSSPVIYVGTTGNDAAAVTGLINLSLSSGNTNQCPGDYVASFRIISPSGVPSAYPTEGLRILPTVLPYG